MAVKWEGLIKHHTIRTRIADFLEGIRQGLHLTTDLKQYGAIGDGSDCTSCLKDAVSKEKHLTISAGTSGGSYKITKDVTVDAGKTVSIRSDAQITVDGATLTFNGVCKAPRELKFVCANGGKVVFNAGQEVKGEWVVAPDIDQSAEFQMLWDECADGTTVDFGQGTFLCGDVIVQTTARNNIIWRGHQTVIKQVGGGGATGPIKNWEIRDFKRIRVTGFRFDLNSAAVENAGDRSVPLNFFRCEQVWVDHCTVFDSDVNAKVAAHDFNRFSFVFQICSQIWVQDNHSDGGQMELNDCQDVWVEKNLVENADQAAGIGFFHTNNDHTLKNIYCRANVIRDCPATAYISMYFDQPFDNGIFENVFIEKNVLIASASPAIPFKPLCEMIRVGAGNPGSTKTGNVMRNININDNVFDINNTDIAKAIVVRGQYVLKGGFTLNMIGERVHVQQNQIKGVNVGVGIEMKEVIDSMISRNKIRDMNDGIEVTSDIQYNRIVENIVRVANEGIQVSNPAPTTYSGNNLVRDNDTTGSVTPYNVGAMASNNVIKTTIGLYKDERIDVDDIYHTDDSDHFRIINTADGQQIIFKTTNTTENTAARVTEDQTFIVGEEDPALDTSGAMEGRGGGTIPSLNANTMFLLARTGSSGNILPIAFLCGTAGQINMTFGDSGNVQRVEQRFVNSATAANRLMQWYINTIKVLELHQDAPILQGTGTPEGAVAAPVGSIFRRRDGGASTSLYVKESGTGNTGWVAK